MDPRTILRRGLIVLALMLAVLVTLFIVTQAEASAHHRKNWTRTVWIAYDCFTDEDGRRDCAVKKVTIKPIW